MTETRKLNDQKAKTVAEIREEARSRVLATMAANDLEIDRHRTLVAHDGTQH
ncbi:hypothetical protein HFN01_35740 [Rhizobium leguminosarum]|uniref:hypothetical protein n=1 Tax=Rhizobium leguminosarum TaxID=384 RepID=UPI00144195B4|nr:hypothetical protein [Rhizobium leguminosarum]MBY5318570.1 hypothetical protein [Rhizobium leguminosarum]MBY5400146.1 hypothetical protein [Rhizobium leguminosarum]MBY5516775.1 hypothetical protein [Rhizobium leguminosarum]